MRFWTLVFVATAAACGPAMAALVTGNEVSVNPIAGRGGVLLYPGGQYMRVVQPLLQPGEKPGPIQLHMPGTRPARSAAAPSVAAPAPRQAVAAPRPSPAPAPARRVAVAPPARSMGAPQGAAGLTLAPTHAPQLAKAAPPVAPVTGQPAPPGLTKRSVILFAAGATDPAQSALGAIKFLAGDLNAAMVGPSARVQILAYGGDKGSDARRLSLKRALAIRQVLIDDGVASERIDVRAMGGADDGGPADRVDVYVKT